MKLLFFGDCMFGRDNHDFTLNPFQFVSKFIKQADYIFFNLETVISPKPLSENLREDKTFNYQSGGEQLMTLRDMTNKPIFASIANNHSLDYGTKGIENTRRFLRRNGFLGAKSVECERESKHEFRRICFMSASDHCGCKNPEKWAKNIWMIDHNNLESLLRKIRILKEKDNFIVFSIHWGANYLKKKPEKMIRTGRKLVDAGVDIVFGHSAHHIPPEPIEIYRNSVIIYGLGDFINDYAVDKEYESDRALMCMIDTAKDRVEPIKVRREFVDEFSSIPII